MEFLAFDDSVGIRIEVCYLKKAFAGRKEIL